MNPLDFCVKSNFSTVISSLDDDEKIWPSCHFLLDGMTALWATPFFSFAAIKFFAFRPRKVLGSVDFSGTEKRSQWPHLYTTYEATYDLKCLLSEILPKN